MRTFQKILCLAAICVMVQNYLSAQEKSDIKFADTLRESKVTSVFLNNDPNGKLVGTFGSKPGFSESRNIRKQVAEKGKDELLKSIQKKYPGNIELSALEIDSLDNQKRLVQLRYNIDADAPNADVFYFNPMLSEGYKDNPFKSERRSDAVTMPYTIDDLYIFSMDIPTGYEVDELPQSVKISLDQDDGSFEYTISKSNTTVNLRSRIRLNRATFGSEEYATLRNFFAQIVKKQSEQIVFKKKK